MCELFQILVLSLDNAQKENEIYISILFHLTSFEDNNLYCNECVIEPCLTNLHNLIASPAQVF